MTEHTAMSGGAEFDAIRRMLGVWGSAARGIGDDAAVLDVPPGERLVVSTDASIENVHFRRTWASAEAIGARAAVAALSDLAAMAATPRGLLLALGLPPSWRNDLEDLARGVGRIASACDCPIVGGNIASASELSLTITVLGSAVSPLMRSGARVGDVLLVTGELGASGAAVRNLLAGSSDAELPERAPRIREAIWLVDHGARAAIDISDGLLADAGHLARASGVSFDIDHSALPCSDGVAPAEAATSGEEYELLVAMPEVPDIAAFERQFSVRLTVIGRVVPARAESLAKGYDHLRNVR